MKQNIIILDGHDCAGKTTLATKLATKINGKYIKPFSDSLGDLIAWSIDKEKYEFANEISQCAINKQISENSDLEYLIFDRHWLSMYTVLPELLWSTWKNSPKTILCWANLDVTNQRMNERGEKEQWDGCNAYYCNLYLQLAKKFNVPVIDTSINTSIEDNLLRIIDIIKY